MTSENGSQNKPERKVGNDLHEALGGDLSREKRRQFNRIASDDERNGSIMRCADDIAFITRVLKSNGG
ncbi:hypothetical protein NVP1031O_133 [Vibrio phage 1.031.O._10N.261.46.F8]|nr:hypothetical protein NVP1031O_133 [Vibrio phage 1.031.O._10N.261.46.F8]